MSVTKTLCPMCSLEFDEDDSRVECARCALFGGCRKVRCPGCGYEIPETSSLLRWLQERVSRRKVGKPG